MNTNDWDRMNTLLGADTLNVREEQELCKLARKAQLECDCTAAKCGQAKMNWNETQWSMQK